MKWPLLDAGIALAATALAAPVLVRFNYWLYRTTGLIKRTPEWDLRMQRWTRMVRVGCAAAALLLIVLGIR